MSATTVAPPAMPTPHFFSFTGRGFGSSPAAV
jgi:hypothetical protein